MHSQAFKPSMEHLIITLFWTATLFGYLQANPVDATISLMLKDINCPSDSTFYAPENVEEHCITAALECAERELNGTVRFECQGPQIRVDHGVKMLREYRKWKETHGDRVLPAAGECVCEAWPQASFSEFLRKTKTLTEQVKVLRSRGASA